MKAKYILLLLLITLSFPCISQKDTFHTISFTLNPLNNLFNQHTLEIEYQINNKYTVGIGGGLVKANPWWGISDDNDLNPIGVYNGWLMIMNFKRLNSTKNHWYFETSLFYKYLYYDHVFFENSSDDESFYYAACIRSEIANVFGIKLFVGERINLLNHFAIEPILGCSVRLRHRAYVTPWAIHMYNRWGVSYRNQVFPGLHAGLLLTIGNFRIK